MTRRSFTMPDTVYQALQEEAERQSLTMADILRQWQKIAQAIQSASKDKNQRVLIETTHGDGDKSTREIVFI